MFILHFLLGVLLAAAGVYGIRYNYQLTNNFGRFSWAERYLGSGGTYLVFKLLCVLLIIVGFLIAFGLWGPVTNWLLSPLGNILSGSE